MSRATRPLRRVRGADQERLRERWLVVVLFGRCRPSALRRCLLGLPVSARAAGRILRAAGR